MLDDIIVLLVIFAFLILVGTLIVFLYQIFTGKPFWPSFKKMMGYIVKWI